MKFDPHTVPWVIHILEHHIGLGLSRTLGVGVVQQILDSQQDLVDVRRESRVNDKDPCCQKSK